MPVPEQAPGPAHARRAHTRVQLQLAGQDLLLAPGRGCADGGPQGGPVRGQRGQRGGLHAADGHAGRRDQLIQGRRLRVLPLDLGPACLHAAPCFNDWRATPPGSNAFPERAAARAGHPANGVRGALSVSRLIRWRGSTCTSARKLSRSTASSTAAGRRSSREAASWIASLRALYRTAAIAGSRSCSSAMSRRGTGRSAACSWAAPTRSVPMSICA